LKLKWQLLSELGIWNFFVINLIAEYHLAHRVQNGQKRIFFGVILCEVGFPNDLIVISYEVLFAKWLETVDKSIGQSIGYKQAKTESLGKSRDLLIAGLDS